MGVTFERHIDRVGVTAWIRAGLEERHLIVLRQQIGARQSRNAGADDSDPLTAWLGVRSGVTHGWVSGMKRVCIGAGIGLICAPMIEIRSRGWIGCRAA